MKFIYLIPLLPLLGFLFNLIRGRRPVGGKTHGESPGHGHAAPSPIIGLVACGTVALAFLVSLYAVFQARGAPEHTIVETLWEWIPAAAATGAATPFRVDWAYPVDPLSSVICLVVTFLAFLTLVPSSRNTPPH